jgi:hypothetical protein
VPLYNLPSIQVDAAVIKPPARLDCDNVMECGTPTGIRDLWVAEDESEVIVHKQGASSSLTTGELLPIRADVFVEEFPTEYTAGWWVYGSGGSSFASPGDSGAIVVDDARRVVGMVVVIEKRDEPAAFVHGIRQIFTALQVELR